VAENNDWTPHGKDKHPSVAMQGEAAEVVHAVFTKATYGETTGILEDGYENK
jgi:hypothetical protein